MLGAEPALEHPTRRDILAMVAARPGITVPQMGAMSELARTVVEHHVGVLVRRGLLVRERHGGRNHYVPAVAARLPSTSRALAVLAQPLRGAAIAILEGSPEPLTLGEILQRWRGAPPSRPLLCYHLDALTKGGVASASGRPRAWSSLRQGAASRAAA